MKGLLHEPGRGVIGTGIPIASIVNKLGERGDCISHG